MATKTKTPATATTGKGKQAQATPAPVGRTNGVATGIAQGNGKGQQLTPRQAAILYALHAQPTPRKVLKAAYGATSRVMGAATRTGLGVQGGGLQGAGLIGTTGNAAGGGLLHSITPAGTAALQAFGMAQAQQAAQAAVQQANGKLASVQAMLTVPTVTPATGKGKGRKGKATPATK